MDLGDIKDGRTIEIDGVAFLVVKSQHAKMGRGGGLVKARLKNLKTGATIERNIKQGDSFTEAEVARQKATYLYADPKAATFMNKDDYDQFTIDRSTIENQLKYLVEGTDVDVLYVSDEPVGLDLPVKLEYRVTDTPPSVKGNTVSGGSKQAKIETGATVSVPLFIKTGDIIRVNTQTGEYVERATNS